jgi:hypothetical protein
VSTFQSDYVNRYEVLKLVQSIILIENASRLPSSINLAVSSDRAQYAIELDPVVEIVASGEPLYHPLLVIQLPKDVALVTWVVITNPCLELAPLRLQLPLFASLDGAGESAGAEGDMTNP